MKDGGQRVFVRVWDVRETGLAIAIQKECRPVDTI